MFLKIWTKTSTKNYSEQIKCLQAALQECEAVVIGAGSGLSTAAGYTYTGERFQKYFADFAEKYSIRDMYSKYLAELSKEQLLELIELYAKNWLAHDGVWFQSIERKFGMAEAMYHDEEAWKRFTVIEAKHIKEFLQLPENPGLEGLEQALHYRFYGNLNEHECIREGNRLVYRNRDCRVQTARSRKGMPYHPCKSVGIYEYSGFAATIDARIKCRCLSCFPDCTESPDGCVWEFYLEEE